MKCLRFAALLSVLLLASCASVPKDNIKTVTFVDLPRFMGDWYVIASIPTFLEKGAFNAVESYRLDAHGTIATTFRFHKNAFDGPLKTMKPRGWVQDRTSNARWGMQFVWPLKAEYLIAYIDQGYTETIVARNARDFVWIMARKPDMADADYQRLLAEVGRLGYDTTKVMRVPQRWPRGASPAD
jgi:apolipoprotein D and lipocalin family protein